MRECSLLLGVCHILVDGTVFHFFFKCWKTENNMCGGLWRGWKGWVAFADIWYPWIYVFKTYIQIICFVPCVNPIYPSSWLLKQPSMISHQITRNIGNWATGYSTRDFISKLNGLSFQCKGEDLRSVRTPSILITQSLNWIWLSHLTEFQFIPFNRQILLYELRQFIFCIKPCG